MSGRSTSEIFIAPICRDSLKTGRTYNRSLLYIDSVQRSRRQGGLHKRHKLTQLQPMNPSKIVPNRTAFTLVELLVVIAIIGILSGMLLPAVQSVRDAARRTECQSRMANIGLALLNYESAHSRFPLGNSWQTNHSWNSASLPWLEQQAVFDRIDFEKPWSDPVENVPVGQTQLPIFHCPSSNKDYRGKTDYCGITGSWDAVGSGPTTGSNGVLLSAKTPKSKGVSMQDIFDGTSYTIAVGEGTGVEEINFGFWLAGRNCFTHEGSINNPESVSQDMYGEHTGGANTLLASGAVRFIVEATEASIVNALCSRDGNEVVDDF